MGDRGPLCPDCGHPTWRHQHAGPPTQSAKDGDPFPCCALVPRRTTTPPDSPLRHSEDHDYCGCFTILPIEF